MSAVTSQLPPWQVDALLRRHPRARNPFLLGRLYLLDRPETLTSKAWRDA